MEKQNLQAVERVEIVILADNYSDILLPPGPCVARPPLAKDNVIATDTVLAEHGLCLLVRLEAQGKTHSVLLDTGYCEKTVPHNLKYLDLTLDGVAAVVLSHGHMDHTGGLEAVLEMTGKGTRLIVHPDAFSDRSIALPTGDTIGFPGFPSRQILEGWGADVEENKAPLLIADDTVLVTGEVARTTAFEKGMPNALIKKNGGFEPDTFTDDQSLVVHLAGKGLVVISGCAHSGIINSVEYAKAITGQDQIHGVIGGFHLTGPAMAPNIAPTVERLARIPMQAICPMHCTGFEAIESIREQMPESFVRSSVGSTLTFS